MEQNNVFNQKQEFADKIRKRQLKINLLKIQIKILQTENSCLSIKQKQQEALSLKKKKKRPLYKIYSDTESSSDEDYQPVHEDYSLLVLQRQLLKQKEQRNRKALELHETKMKERKRKRTIFDMESHTPVNALLPNTKVCVGDPVTPATVVVVPK